VGREGLRVRCGKRRFKSMLWEEIYRRVCEKRFIEEYGRVFLVRGDVLETGL
jgi:hypothetical protein